jgi:hypothetical protein
VCNIGVYVHVCICVGGVNVGWELGGGGVVYLSVSVCAFV